MILGSLLLYFDDAVVEVKKNLLLFRLALDILCSAKKIGSEKLNWPGRLAGISEGAN